MEEDFSIEDSIIEEEMPVEIEAVISLTLSRPVTLLLPQKDKYTQAELIEAASTQIPLSPEFQQWDIDDFAVMTDYND